MRIELETQDYRLEQLRLGKKIASSDGIDLLIDSVELSDDYFYCDFYISDIAMTGAYYFSVEHTMIGYVCPHCNCELYKEFKYLGRSLEKSYEKSSIMKSKSEFRGHIMRNYKNFNSLWLYNFQKEHIEPEITKMKQLTKCPLCGANLSHEEGYTLSKQLRDSIDISKAFERIKGSRTVVEKQFAEDQMMQFVSSCDLPVSASISADNLNTIKETPSKLQDYISNLLKLETNVYALQKRLPILYAEQSKLQKAVTAEKYFKIFEKKEEVEQAEFHYAQCQEKIKQYETGAGDLVPPSQPQVPVMGTPGLFNKKKILAENEALKIKYQTDMAIYTEQVRLFEIERANRLELAKEEAKKAKQSVIELKSVLEEFSNITDDKVNTPTIIAKNMIDQEISEAETLLKNLYECRNGLYGYNIVFDKYRNAVALSTFYEYLMAGRCSSLTGSNGAYNIYENEIRADLIIGQLSQVIEKLDDIKANQYMIYTEIQQVNRNLNLLNQTMDKALLSIQHMEGNVETIAKNSEIVAHNTAVTAYYSKVNAELTNALGFMVAFK